MTSDTDKAKSNAHTKSPLGLRPKKVWALAIAQERFGEIKGAIKRYHEKNLDIPSSWVMELIEFYELTEGQPPPDSPPDTGPNPLPEVGAWLECDECGTETRLMPVKRIGPEFYGGACARCNSSLGMSTQHWLEHILRLIKGGQE